MEKMKEANMDFNTEEKSTGKYFVKNHNHIKPQKSGWYNTEKGFLFYHKDNVTADKCEPIEDGWSCRDERMSEEYPSHWYEDITDEINELYRASTSLNEIIQTYKDRKEQFIEADRIVRRLSVCGITKEMGELVKESKQYVKQNPK